MRRKSLSFVFFASFEVPLLTALFMRIDILTLFPTIAGIPLGESMIGKAQQRGLVTIQVHNLRDWARDKHRTTDDAPYGGSQGMVMKCEPIFEAVGAISGFRDFGISGIENA